MASPAENLSTVFWALVVDGRAQALTTTIGEAVTVLRGLYDDERNCEVLQPIRAGVYAYTPPGGVRPVVFVQTTSGARRVSVRLARDVLVLLRERWIEARDLASGPERYKHFDVLVQTIDRRLPALEVN